jgi:predicted patatin/cPLA2 family phospholipase
MKEFYDYSKIDIHLYCTELAGFKFVDISHKTHPEWKVIDAVYASSALPLLFAPHLHEGKYYIDGGIFKNLRHFDCINKCERSIYIHLKMANRVFDLSDYLYLNKTTSKKLFDYGWNDSEKLFKNFHK